jgi:DNA topoisomerase-1
MTKSLIIVESPAKTRTLGSFVGRGYDIAASMGHVRDLPLKRLGVDIENDFAPEYEPLAERKTALASLRRKVKGADAVYLASDPDREGEAIAWHLAQALKLKEPRRIEFNEITRGAVQHALEHPRGIDMRRVDAQQARRILDRLVGYKLSPLLMRKLRRRTLSAGRVQSVAVKLACDREREIEAFQPREYWDIFAQLTPTAEEYPFRAKLVEIDGAKGKVDNGEQAASIADDARKQSYRVARVKRSDNSRRPLPPFITSTLQQDASVRLGMPPRRTMALAQQLYEGLEIGDEGPVGLITYMRTDSTRVAQEAQQEARAYISAQFGDNCLPERPRQFAARKGAQEAHEAIRPTSVSRTPDAVARYLDPGQLRLYRLIWSRFIASQMANAVLDVMVVDAVGGPYLFRVTGQAVKFAGFMRVYSPSKAAEEGAEIKLPVLQEGQELRLLDLETVQKFTEPLPRYTEASLVRVLEAKGIGRPSTYAPILATIRERGYVYLDDEKPKHLRPTDLGFVVTDQLAEHFPRIMDVEFTARVEEQLDRVEQGENDWVQLLREFYGPFAESLARAEENMGAAPVPPAPEVAPTPEATPTLAAPEVAGAPAQPAPETEPPLPFITRKGTVTEDSLGKRATVVDASDLSLLKVGNERGTEYPVGRKAVRRIVSSPKPAPPPPLAQEASPEVTPRPAAPLEPVQAEPTAARSVRTPARETLEKCPQCGKALVVRVGKHGPFLACSGYPECRYTAPVGGKDGDKAEPQPTDEVCAECGKPMLLRTGRHGPFLGCSGYPECKHTRPPKAQGEGEEAGEASGDPAQVEAQAPQKDCPECRKPMLVRRSRRGPFLGCSGYPTCRHTEPLAAGDRQRQKRDPPQPTGETCDQCGQPMVLRAGRRGSFVGCSGYPKCRNTRPAPEPEHARPEADAQARADA